MTDKQILNIYIYINRHIEKAVADKDAAKAELTAAKKLIEGLINASI